MENENEMIKLLQKKADAYLVLNDRVHIKYKHGGWKRGIIYEVSADFFMIDETLEGKTPVFFQEIESIEKFNPRIKEEKYGTRN